MSLLVFAFFSLAVMVFRYEYETTKIYRDISTQTENDKENDKENDNDLIIITKPNTYKKSWLSW